MAKDDMFRKEAMDQLSSPDQLEQLMEVTTRKGWITLYTTGASLAMVLLWSIFGQIPITVDGTAVLIHPRRVVSLQAPAAGELSKLNVTVGSLVKKGDVIAELEHPDLTQALAAERIRLRNAESRDALRNEAADKRTALEKQSIAGRDALLAQRMRSLTESATRNRASNAQYFASQRQALSESRVTQEKIGEALKERFASYERLRAEGLMSDDSVLGARQRFMDNQLQRAEFEVKAKELAQREVEQERSYQDAMDKVEELRKERENLQINQQELVQKEIESLEVNGHHLREVRRNIASMEAQLAHRGQIVSDYAGRIVELTVGPGQLVNGGQRVATIETENDGSELAAIAFFDIGPGKKLAAGGEIRITPVTVERERFGSMVADIQSVSPYPVTTDTVSALIGNQEVAQTITRSHPVIEVGTLLRKDSEAHTGYQWTSGKGPPVTITSGTTATARATVELRAPITFVIPILRRWTGLG